MTELKGQIMGNKAIMMQTEYICNMYSMYFITDKTTIDSMKYIQFQSFSRQELNFKIFLSWQGTCFCLPKIYKLNFNFLMTYFDLIVRAVSI